MERFYGHNRARRPKRMSQRDSTPIGIGLGGREAQIANHGQRLRGKGFVHFENVDLIGSQSGSLEYLLYR